MCISDRSGNCNDSSCQVRACYTASTSGTGGQLYCYFYSGNTNLYRIPSWNPTNTQIQTQNYGQNIVSAVVRSWFNSHQALQRVLAVSYTHLDVYKRQFLIISSQLPGYLKEVEPSLLASVQKYISESIKEFREYQDKDLLKWNISAVPNPYWAKALNLQNEEELWKYIFDLLLIRLAPLLLSILVMEMKDLRMHKMCIRDRCW